MTARLSGDSSGFVPVTDVVPDAALDIRYYSENNFVGERIDGYEAPLALLTREAAEALKAAADELRAQGWRVKIFDAYRPQRAVDHFVRWAEDAADIRMKARFYPDLDKTELIPGGFIAARSGHSRGSTVDLTLLDAATGVEADMGGPFDFFGERSHPDYAAVTPAQHANRMRLRDAMLRHGFRPLSTEWWHFTLENEPYPDTYFTFPVR
ncbi:MAG: M15 family metallopeptidase [Clostridia bacterium]|nr:M15 family metallopeptidase [Clostridia bacterium]